MGLRWRQPHRDDLQLSSAQGADLSLVSSDAVGAVLFTYPGTGIDWGAM
ncbi:hypothetical protein [Streptomyces sp. NPDC001480]